MTGCYWTDWAGRVGKGPRTCADLHLSLSRPNTPTFFPLTSSGYIGEFEIVDDHRGGKIVIQLNGRLNKAGVISPRFNVAVDAIENWVALLLPARSFGKMILTTSAGIMDHEEARRKHVGGKILAYVY
jgi:small subunit ribosomal protein S15Ae